MNREAEYNVMLDPSLLLADEFWDYGYQGIYQLQEHGARLYVPAALMDLVSGYYDRSIDDVAARRFVQFYGQRNEPYMDQEEPTASLDRLGEFLSETEIRPFRLEEEDLALGPYLGFRALLQEVLEQQGENDSGLLSEAIFQEYVFLQERSWIVARLRRVFDRMMQSGATVIGHSKRAFDWTVRKTRGKESDEPIKHVDVLIAAGKWVAIGGSTAVTMGLITPPGGLAIAFAVAPAFFFLIDP